VSLHDVCSHFTQISGGHSPGCAPATQPQGWATGAADEVFRSMSALRVVTLDADGAYMAAQSAIRYKLHMADALIWQTAQAHGAMLYTQDAALAHLPDVKYQAKK